MRIVTVRGWSKEYKKMWESPTVNFATNEMLQSDGEWYQVDKLLMPTGLTDRHGVEIFEGDIVKMSHDLHIGHEIVANKGEFVNVIVEWVNGSFRLNRHGNPSKNYYGVIYYSENTEPELLEVIGNIYENPELLK